MVKVLPDYITEDKYLNKLLTKEQLIERNNEEKKVKDMLHMIWSMIAKAYESNETIEQVNVSKSFLESHYNYQAHEHENIIVEFFTDKGYIVSITDDGFIFQ